MPITISAIAIINISISFSCTLNVVANFSINFSESLSNTKHKIPVGIVDITMYQKILPSVDFFFLITWLYPPFIRFTQSLKKNRTIANNVPICNATSNDGLISFHPNIHGNTLPNSCTPRQNPRRLSFPAIHAEPQKPYDTNPIHRATPLLPYVPDGRH